MSENKIDNSKSLENFKNTMSQFPTGVAIATSLDSENQPAGMTVSSFVSICLEPQVVMISVGKHLALAKAIEHSQKYAINILADNQDDIGMAFATKTSKMSDRFNLAGFDSSRNLKLPLIKNCIASLETRLVDAKPMGDHILFFGAVQNCKINQENLNQNRKPIIYFNRSWSKLA